MKVLTIVIKSSSKEEMKEKFSEMLDEYFSLRENWRGKIGVNCGSSEWDFEEMEIEDNAPCIWSVVNHVNTTK